MFKSIVNTWFTESLLITHAAKIPEELSAKLYSDHSVTIQAFLNPACHSVYEHQPVFSSIAQSEGK